MAMDRRSFAHELWHVPGAHHRTQRHSHPPGAHDRERICAHSRDRTHYFPCYLSRDQAAVAIAGEQIRRGLNSLREKFGTGQRPYDPSQAIAYVITDGLATTRRRSKCWATLE